MKEEGENTSLALALPTARRKLRACGSHLSSVSERMREMSSLSGEYHLVERH